MSETTAEPGQGLPFSHGRSFSTLDEYLAHLREFAAPVDQPWFRKIGPDLYEEVGTIRPAGEVEKVTRGQLMQRFGFTA